jgi:hypothetical protein
MGAIAAGATPAVAASRAALLPRMIPRQSVCQEDSTHVFQIEPQHLADTKGANLAFPIGPSNGLPAHAHDEGNFLHGQ